MDDPFNPMWFVSRFILSFGFFIWIVIILVRLDSMLERKKEQKRQSRKLFLGTWSAPDKE